MADDITKALTNLVESKVKDLTTSVNELKIRLDALVQVIAEKADNCRVEALSGQVQTICAERDADHPQADLISELMSGRAAAALANEQTSRRLSDVSKCMASKAEASLVEALSRQIAELHAIVDGIRAGGPIEYVNAGPWWSCSRRQTLARRAHLPVETLAGGDANGSTTHAARPRSKSGGLSPQDLLAAILKVEGSCMCVDDSSAEKGLARPQVECLVDLPSKKFFVHTVPDSASMTSCFWVHFEDIGVEEVYKALTSWQERKVWDDDSGLKLLRSHADDDELEEETIHVVLPLPWPLWDRDILQRWWKVPLDADTPGGRAIVLRSVSDEILLPEMPGRIRAFVHKGAYVMRPGQDGTGVEVTIINEADPGGVVPAWSRSVLTNFAAQRTVQWSNKLHGHCLAMRQRAADD